MGATSNCQRQFRLLKLTAKVPLFTLTQSVLDTPLLLIMYINLLTIQK